MVGVAAAGDIDGDLLLGRVGGVGALGSGSKDASPRSGRGQALHAEEHQQYEERDRGTHVRLE